MFRFGVCTSIDNIEKAASLGFDFIEYGFSRLNALTEDEFREAVKRVEASPIRVEACNGMLPPELKVTGEDVDEQAIRTYLDRTFTRAKLLGVEVVVFGSGAARNVPAGYPHEKAWRDIAAYLRIAEEYCEKYRLDVAIEPLRRKECNIINFVSEGMLLCSFLNLPHIGVLGDTHHMLSGSEPYAALAYAGSRLRHIHISHSFGPESGRDYPYEGDGEDHAGLFETLSKMDYRGRVSIEAGCNDFMADGAKALELMRKLAR